MYMSRAVDLVVLMQFLIAFLSWATTLRRNWVWVWYSGHNSQKCNCYTMRNQLLYSIPRETQVQNPVEKQYHGFSWYSGWNSHQYIYGYSNCYTVRNNTFFPLQYTKTVQKYLKQILLTSFISGMLLTSWWTVTMITLMKQYSIKYNWTL